MIKETWPGMRADGPLLTNGLSCQIDSSHMRSWDLGLVHKHCPSKCVKKQIAECARTSRDPHSLCMPTLIMKSAAENTGIDLGIGLLPVLEALGPTSKANNSSLPISSVQSGPNMFYVFLVGSGEVIDRTL